MNTRERIQKLRDEGMTFEQISRVIEVSMFTVMRWLKDESIQIRPQFERDVNAKLDEYEAYASMKDDDTIH